MWSRTKEIFRQRPLLMNMASFGTMYVGAEVAQQCILIRRNPERTIDWGSVKRYAIIGLAGIGPALFYWYRILDRLVPGATRKAVIQKVLADQAISSTSCLVIFFTGMSILEGREDIFAELKAKFFSTYTFSCCFWLPAQAINFALLPPYTRVAFVGIASFVWVNVLCLIKRQEVPTTTTTPLPPHRTYYGEDRNHMTTVSKIETPKMIMHQSDALLTPVPDDS